MERRGRRHPNGLAYLPVALPLVLWGVALSALVSIGNTGDTPCGSLLDPSFADAFDPSNLCGTVHFGTLIVASGLIIGGCIVMLVGALASRGPAPLWLPAAVLAVMAAAASVTWLVLTSRSGHWTRDFDVRRWTPVRNLSGFAAAMNAVALGFGLVVAFSEPNAEEATLGRR